MTSLLEVSDDAQARIVHRAGVAALVVIVGALAAYLGIHATTRTPKGVIPVAIDTPYVGQGVADGTPLMMHGFEVGKVTGISKTSGGAIRLTANLRQEPIKGLTDALGIDFRPANYFGVTGINLIPNQGGNALRAGSTIRVTPSGNFTLQALLYRLGEISNQVVTPRLVGVVERVTQYTDALNPLLETLIVISQSVTRTQTVSTEQLVRNATGINVAFPGFVDALVSTGDLFLKSNIGIGYNPDQNLKENPFVSMYDPALMKQYNEARHLLATDPDLFVQGRFKEWLKGSETDLFAKVGKLLSSHIYDLFPVVEEARIVADVVPKLVPAGDVAATLQELRTRLEHMYAGSGEQRALQVRIILDKLPSLEAPMTLALGAAG